MPAGKAERIAGGTDIAYLDDFKLMILLTFAVLPLLLLMRKARGAGAPAMAAD